jgi:citrate/tricarballylate utilization protein
MTELDILTQQAKSLAQDPWSMNAEEKEVARQMQICNACRYCEGFCAVFPAMTRRLVFAKADVHYLANLCHNCGACLHSCQYAPPNAFAVNVPQAMAKVRGLTYSSYAWPKALGQLYQQQGLTLCLAVAVAFCLLLGLGVSLQAGAWSAASERTDGNFYAVFPHGWLLLVFGIAFSISVLSLAMGVRKFWCDIKSATSGAALSAEAAMEATSDTMQLKYLGGGHGEGCNNEDDAFSLQRRRAHHLTFYGFMLCFAATSVATLYHYFLGWSAPYEFTSLPKLLGSLGGVMLLLGSLGLLRLNLLRHPDHGAKEQRTMDRGFIMLLILISASGLGLMLGRNTTAMTGLLLVHLSSVLALFVTLPYGKFAHGIYRMASLMRFSVEKRQPNRLGISGE